MSLGELIIARLESHRQKKLKSRSDSLGAFYRDGGNNLLYDVPVSTGSLVIDAGGYKGDWTARMLAVYGCRSELYEPVPTFANHCRERFGNNSMVCVHPVALGGSSRVATYDLADTGTSEFKRQGNHAIEAIKATVIDVLSVFDELGGTKVACLKLNIEGGEYEVLERLLKTGYIAFCDSLLIQFHRQPADYELRYKNIVDALQATHVQSYCYPMVWEKWIQRDGQ